MSTFQIKRLYNNAKLPSKANHGDAGYDLFALEDGVIAPGERAMVKTGITMSIPLGYYGRIAPRSGYAWKQGIDVLAGVLDSPYRGPVNVILLNTDKYKEFTYKAGDAIAQLIIEVCKDYPVEEVEELDQTSRGSDGFGSTGSRNTN